jgi:hypothetical protein
MTCHEATQSLGAYVLRALEPAERAKLDAHLLDCPECAAELAELEELPELLGRLSLDDVVAPVVSPSDDLFDRVARAARRESARTRPARRTRLLAAAAAVVIVAAAGVGIGLAQTNHQSSVTFAAASGATHMSVTVTGRATGTDLVVSVDGLPVDEHCTLVAVSRSGTWETAGSWVATYSGTAKVTGSTTIPRGELAEFVLEGTHGEVLVKVPV